MLQVVRLMAAFGLLAAVFGEVPTIPLYNTAQPGMRMPAVGLGTGGYGGSSKVGYNGYPECWSEVDGCGGFTQQAVSSWLSLGGRRLDLANSYFNQAAVGDVISKSNVTREDLFVLTKIGPSFPLGYEDALMQFEQIKKDLQVDHVDMLLIHWPKQNPSQGNVSQHKRKSTDPACQPLNPLFNETLCRINTWKALLLLHQEGQARAVGVSNYDIEHFEEIKRAGLPLPSLTQNPFHIYRSSSQMDLVRYCHAHNITFLGYSPFGIPDWHTYHGTDMAASQFDDRVVQQLAQKYNKTPSQILLAWQWGLGIPANPRTMNATHMQLNLDSYDFVLAAEDSDSLSSRPQDTCQIDPGFYECAP